MEAGVEMAGKPKDEGLDAQSLDKEKQDSSIDGNSNHTGGKEKQDSSIDGNSNEKQNGISGKSSRRHSFSKGVIIEKPELVNPKLDELILQVPIGNNILAIDVGEANSEVNSSETKNSNKKKAEIPYKEKRGSSRPRISTEEFNKELDSWFNMSDDEDTKKVERRDEQKFRKIQALVDKNTIGNVSTASTFEDPSIYLTSNEDVDSVSFTTSVRSSAKQLQNPKTLKKHKSRKKSRKRRTVDKKKSTGSNSQYKDTTLSSLRQMYGNLSSKSSMVLQKLFNNMPQSEENKESVFFGKKFERLYKQYFSTAEPESTINVMLKRAKTFGKSANERLKKKSAANDIADPSMNSGKSLDGSPAEYMLKNLPHSAEVAGKDYYDTKNIIERNNQQNINDNHSFDSIITFSSEDIQPAKTCNGLGLQYIPTPLVKSTAKDRRKKPKPSGNIKETPKSAPLKGIKKLRFKLPSSQGTPTDGHISGEEMELVKLPKPRKKTKPSRKQGKDGRGKEHGNQSTKARRSRKGHARHENKSKPEKGHVELRVTKSIRKLAKQASVRIRQ